MKSQFWGLLASTVLVAGCGINNDQTDNPEEGHGTTLGSTTKKLQWGPPAPVPPLTPSPVPQLPEQPGPPINPGDTNGPKAEDKLIPNTSAPAMPK